MMHRPANLPLRFSTVRTMALTTLFASAVLVGCGEEPVVVAPVVKAAPVKAPEPEPVKIATIKELMAKYDIDRWLETGRTDHFVVPEIYKVQS